MPFDEVVIGEVQAHSSFKILKLLTEAQRQVSEAAHVKASSSIQALNIAGRDQVNIGEPHNNPLLSRNEFGGAVAVIVAHFLGAVGLDDLRVVYTAIEGAFNRVHICL